MISTLQQRLIIFLLLPITFLISSGSFAEVVEYDLTISQEEVNITGNLTQAMTINGGIPGPALRFREGDTARIHVHNEMDISTSIHWHGILVPPDMDGVPFISFPPIAPDTTFTYEFPIRQSGTYWYHSHTGLQEQRGVYGAIVIEPASEHQKTDRDYVVVLSDWTDEDPHEVLRTLKMGSEWYSIEKGSGQSILGALRLGMLNDYFKRELLRMPPMDISDVAYDRFLANGMPEIALHAEPGETVRLRIIDGSATTYFHLEFAGGPLQIISADGQDVDPVKLDRFLICVAETYDVTLKIPKNGSFELRATAHDGSNYASIWIGTGTRHAASGIPRPNLYRGMGEVSLVRVLSLTPAGSMGMDDNRVKSGMFDKPGMMNMGAMDMDHGHEMKDMDMKESSGTDMDHKDHQPHSGASDPDSQVEMDHAAQKSMDQGHRDRSGKKYSSDFSLLGADVSSSEKLAVDGIELKRPWPPYSKLGSKKPTAFSKDQPTREIRLTLDGDMNRYVWLLNNKVLAESDDLLIRKGEVVKFIMINRTMMHHPMHLHGHFFRVITEKGDYSPLKHTVDVAPMSTTVIEFDANEFGDWFFHCHLLYHMKSGMARLTHYEGYQPDSEVNAVRENLYKDPWYAYAHAKVLTSMTDGHVTVSNTRNILMTEWEAGWNSVDKTEWDGTVTWSRYINRFFHPFIGGDIRGEGSDSDDLRGVLGLSYLLPINIDSRFWIDTDGELRINLEKEFELTPRLMPYFDVEYDTLKKWEGIIGLSYLISRHFSLAVQWHSDFMWGAGIQILF